ncbi:hypothetical protein BTO18_13345 [Polaribacter porphyrae]|uniref:Adhesin domain-containing protein n=1 Tax=Polaribacter porphyrae TaxID=1137780 RepID=A0A2S7WR65_9FLAO|nr:hypothetical protein BTO18_13345 [Polaribacter porphyrae]
MVTIDTSGLDHLSIENSNNEFVEVILYAENYDDQLIKVDTVNRQVTIKFELSGTETREVIFRKFITKRLQRADAVIKVPKGISINIFGENVDVTSKSINNKLSVYIDNGIIKLNKIQHKIIVKLYSGNVYANINNIKIDVNSNQGKIEVNGVLYKRKYKKTPKKTFNKLEVTTVKGNVILKNSYK